MTAPTKQASGAGGVLAVLDAMRYGRVTTTPERDSAYAALAKLIATAQGVDDFFYSRTVSHPVASLRLAALHAALAGVSP